VDKAYTYETGQKETIEEFKILKTIVNEIAKIERSTSEEWIETLMIYYNSEAGKLLKTHGLGILRHHSEPDIEKLKYMSSIDPSLEKMAFSAATYVTSDSVGRHWGLNTDDYAHASSPLRRYADLYNQRCILAILKSENVPSQNAKSLCRQLNILQKNAKAFERDEFFISTLAKTKEALVLSLVIDINEEKQFVKLWVKEWNRIIRVKTVIKTDEIGKYVEAKDGATERIELKKYVTLTYYINYDKVSWKDKIIFRIHSKDVGIGCLE
jgi:exoribonuclease II